VKLFLKGGYVQTTKELAVALGCTPQAINKAIRKACKEQNINLNSFGSPHPKDRRIRIFSETEVETILKYAPTPRAVSETRSPVVESELIEPVTPSSLAVRSPQALMSFDVQTLNINLLITSTEALDTERKGFNQLTAQALQGLKQITKDETRATIAEMKAQIQHAIAGVQAVAVTEAVQEVVKPVSEPQKQTIEQ
jgi:hypothetical protein